MLPCVCNSNPTTRALKTSAWFCAADWCVRWLITRYILVLTWSGCPVFVCVCREVKPCPRSSGESIRPPGHKKTPLPLDLNTESASVTLFWNSVPSTKVHRWNFWSFSFIFSIFIFAFVVFLMSRTPRINLPDAGGPGTLLSYFLSLFFLFSFFYRLCQWFTSYRKKSLAVQYRSIFLWSCPVDVDILGTNFSVYFCNNVFPDFYFSKMKTV